MAKEVGKDRLGDFYTNGKVRKRREWRGLADTMYDYWRWLHIMGILAGFIIKPRNIKAMLRYRWMANYLAVPSVTAIIDIGGQDVKGIAVDKDGTVLNFAMNDKCAAGTGRFFEAMARAFEMDLTEFSRLSLKAKNVIPITAQCTVFAESEVISLVGEGKPMDEIAAGIELSVAKRCFVMSKKAGATNNITLTGGCAKNDGLKAAIEKVLKLKVIDLPIDPQLIGALGAAEFARQKAMAR